MFDFASLPRWVFPKNMKVEAKCDGYLRVSYPQTGMTFEIHQDGEFFQITCGSDATNIKQGVIRVQGIVRALNYIGVSHQ